MKDLFGVQIFVFLFGNRCFTKSRYKLLLLHLHFHALTLPCPTCLHSSAAIPAALNFQCSKQESPGSRETLPIADDWLESLWQPCQHPLPQPSEAIKPRRWEFVTGLTHSTNPSHVSKGDLLWGSGAKLLKQKHQTHGTHTLFCGTWCPSGIHTCTHTCSHIWVAKRGDFVFCCNISYMQIKSKTPWITKIQLSWIWVVPNMLNLQDPWSRWGGLKYSARLSSLHMSDSHSLLPCVFGGLLSVNNITLWYI